MFCLHLTLIMPYKVKVYFHLSIKNLQNLTHNATSSALEFKPSTKLEIPLNKYNVPTFSPFSITRSPLMTFEVLSVKVVTQPLLPNCPV